MQVGRSPAVILMARWHITTLVALWTEHLAWLISIDRSISNHAWLAVLIVIVLRAVYNHALSLHRLSKISI